MKTITLCGSTKFYSEMEDVKIKLSDMGYSVLSPEVNETIDYSLMSDTECTEFKKKFIDLHIEKIKRGDLVLILNFDKATYKNYIGPNTFLEMGFAYIMNKPIFLLNAIPVQDTTIEIKGLTPIVLNGELNHIVNYL
jgi:nucleoside 2-deoxyribosyltransferase